MLLLPDCHCLPPEWDTCYSRWTDIDMSQSPKAEVCMKVRVRGCLDGVWWRFPVVTTFYKVISLPWRPSVLLRIYFTFTLWPLLQGPHLLVQIRFCLPRSCEIKWGNTVWQFGSLPAHSEHTVNDCYEDGLHCYGRNTLGSILNRLITFSYMKEQGVFKCIGNSYLHWSILMGTF